MSLLADIFIDYFLYIKFIHIFFAFLWVLIVPPATSVFLKSAMMDQLADPDNEELNRRVWWVWDQLDKLIILEHIAWPVLIITGPILLACTGWPVDTPWLAAKLAIIIVIYVPMEIYDIWFSHFYCPRAQANRASDPEGYKRMREEQLSFFRKVSLLVRITIPLLWFLAIVKPSLY